MRVVAANLTSDNKQSYSPDNGNHCNPEGAALAKFIEKVVQKDALLVIGGDLNARTTDEACFKELASVVVIPEHPPADQHGEISTNAPRNRPYDWVLASKSLDKAATPVKRADADFSNGLVFGSRVFEPLDKLAGSESLQVEALIDSAKGYSRAASDTDRVDSKAILDHFTATMDQLKFSPASRETITTVLHIPQDPYPN